jgi:hypothetical protein
MSRFRGSSVRLDGQQPVSKRLLRQRDAGQKGLKHQFQPEIRIVWESHWRNRPDFYGTGRIDGAMRRREASIKDLPTGRPQILVGRPEYVRAAIQTCVNSAYVSGFAPLEAFLPTPE